MSETNPAQRVLVEVRGKKLTYGYRGAEPLQVGDRVRVPAPYWAPDRRQFPNWEGTVVALESDYQGDVIYAQKVAPSTDGGAA